MFVMSEQFTVTLEQSLQASMADLAVDNNNHELQIIADFIVIPVI